MSYGNLALARRGFITGADVEQARKYCDDQLRRRDVEAYLLQQYVPRAVRDGYSALRTLNSELVRVPEIVSSPSIGRVRMQFWRDAVHRIFADEPPREPISILLHRAVTDLKSRSTHVAGTSSIKFWLLRFINTREQYIDNRPFPTLAALEEYAENTYSTLMYMTLAFLPLRSMHVDHLASHIGKACGIVATLRGIPLLAAPPPPVQTPIGLKAGGRSPALLLPLDVMAKAGLREENVFRQGPGAAGLQDAVFEVATRAHDHLLTARHMIQSLRDGRGPGHEFEHQHEEGFAYASPGKNDGTLADLNRAFGVLLEATPAQGYLSSLERQNFDPFRVSRSWTFPWKLWQARRKNEI